MHGSISKHGKGSVLFFFSIYSTGILLSMCCEKGCVLTELKDPLGVNWKQMKERQLTQQSDTEIRIIYRVINGMKIIKAQIIVQSGKAFV